MSTVKGGNRAHRIAIMLAAASRHEGTPMTIAEFAKACGREDGQGFRRDLSAARHRALDQGHRLTHCVIVEGENRLVFKTDAGDDLTGRALQKVNRIARTYTRNAGRHGAWEAEHGETPGDRAYGEMAVRLADGIASFAQAAEILERQMAERR